MPVKIRTQQPVREERKEDIAGKGGERKSGGGRKEKRPVKLEANPGLHPSGFVNAGVANLVSTAYLGCSLDNLADIACKLWNVEYNPSKFHALIWRSRNPDATLLVFRSGRLVCTGTQSETDSYIAVKRLAREMRKECKVMSIQVEDFKVQNIVGSAKFEFQYSPERLCVAPKHFRNITYEPEVFPGLIYRISHPYRMAALIFVSGKIVITGAKSIDNLNATYERMYRIIRAYRK